MSTRQRMSKLSQENLKVAERAELFDLGEGELGVKVWRGERAAVLDGGPTGPLRFCNAAQARRNLRRVRPDLVEQMTSI